MVEFPLHHRWLNFHAIYQALQCRGYFLDEMTGTNSPFLCGHTVEELLRLICCEIFKPSIPPRKWTNALIRNARRSLRYMPYNIKTAYMFKSGSLIITWEDNKIDFIRSSLVNGTSYYIILYAEICLYSSDLLYDTIGKATLEKSMIWNRF